jgi:serine/threonine protein kinase
MGNINACCSSRSKVETLTTQIGQREGNFFGGLFSSLPDSVTL